MFYPCFMPDSCYRNMPVPNYTAPIYDMCNGTMLGAWNLRRNQAYADTSARWWQNMAINTTLNNGYSFLPYSNNTCSPLLDMNYTLGQSWFNSQQGMGCGWSPWMPGCGPFPTTVNNGGNSTTNLDPEEAKFKTKYETLKSLVNAFVEYNKNFAYITQGGENKGKYSERYQALKEKYDAIGDSIIKEFLKNGAKKLGVGSSSTKPEDSFYNKLLGAGFEYGSSEIDSKLSTIYEDIKSLSDKDATAEDLKGIVENINFGSYDILDLISSWNTEYIDDSEAGKDKGRLIGFIAKQCSLIKDNEMKKTAFRSALHPLINALIDKANSLKGSLDKDSQRAIKLAIKELRTAKNKSTVSIDSSLVEKFDKLYLLTRNAAMTKLINEAKNRYGDIDSRVFNDNLFIDDVKEDLIEEGFEASKVESLQVEVDPSLANTNDTDPEVTTTTTATEIDEETADVQVEWLVDEGHFIECNQKVNGQPIYREYYKTGDRDYQRVFTIGKNGKLVEIVGLQFKDDKLVKTSDYSARRVKPSDIAKAQEKAKEKEAETIATTTAATDARSDGKLVFDYCDGFTEDYKHSMIDEMLGKVNKDNVMSFLAGYYEDAGRHDKTEGLIEQLDDEYDGGKISMSNKKNIVNSLLEKAAAVGLENDDDYKQLKALMEIYDKYKTDATTFNHGGWGRMFGSDTWGLAGRAAGGAAIGGAVLGASKLGWFGTALTISASTPGWGWIVGGVLVAGAAIYACCDKVTDNEVIDKLMKSLYKTIKKTMNTPKS